MHSGKRPIPPARIPPPARWALIAILVACWWVAAPAEAAPDGELAPPKLLRREAWLFPHAPTLDGDLSEWGELPAEAEARLDRRDQLHPIRREGWEGPQDASATVQVGVHGDDLYLGIRFVDDVVFHDPERPWWQGDSLELFIDADLPEGGRPPHEFTPGCRQIFVMPANADLPWGVAYRGKRMLMDDGGLRGVQVVRGDHVNGAFEAEVRIPLRNFGIDGRTGGRLGFALALNDADEAPEQPGSYLSWNQGFDLYLHPDHFGTLRIPPAAQTYAPTGGARGGPWWILLALLVAAATAAVLAGPGARWLARVGPRPKWIVLGVTGLVALALYLEAHLSVDAERAAVEERLDDAAEAARGVAAEALAFGALQEEDAAARTRSLVTLLRGKSVPCRPGVTDAALVALHEHGAFRPLGGQVPRYAIDLRRPHDFHLPRPVSADVFRLELDTGFRGRDRDRRRTLGSLTFSARSGAEVRAMVVDDPALPSAAGITLRLEERGPWHRILWQPADRPPRSVLHALVARDPEPDSADRPLLLSGRTRDGIPVLSHGQGTDLGRDVAPGESLTLPLPTVAGADRLWILLHPTKAFPSLLGDHLLGTLALHYDDAEDPAPIELRNGEDLTAPRLPPGIARPPGVRSLVAFRWRDGLGHTRVRQALPLPLDPQRPPRRLTISNAGPGGTLHVTAATVVRTAHTPPDAAVRVVTDERGRDSLLLVDPPRDFAAFLDGAEGEPDARVTAIFAVGPPGGTPLQLTLTGHLREDVASKPDRARTGLLLCLGLAVFLVVLLVVDAAGRMRFLAWRLGAGTLAAALVPLAVTILLVDRENTRRVESEYAARARSGVEDIGRRLQASQAHAQEAARRLARHLVAEGDAVQIAEVSRLADLYGGGAQSVGLVGTAAISGAALPAVQVPLGEGREARGLYGPRFLQGAGERPGLHVSPWDGLLLVGASRAGGADDWVRVTIAVRVEDGFLRDALAEDLPGAGASATLFDESGVRLAGAGPRADALRRDLSSRLPELAGRGATGATVFERVGPPERAQLAVTAPVRATGRDASRAAWLALGVDRVAIDRAVSDERELLVWLGLFGLVLVVGVAALVARRVADPVRELVRVTESVRQGTFDVEVPDAGSDEVGRLTVAFDQMRLDLKHRVEDLDFLRGAQDALAASLEFGRRSHVVLGLFQGRFGPDDALLLDARGPRGPVAVVAEAGGRSRFVERPIAPAEGGWLERALAADAPLDVHPTADDEAFPGEGAMGRRLLADAVAWIAVPLRTGSLVQGLLLMGWKDADALPTAQSRRLLVPLAGITASALNNARLYRLAALDDVTHLPGATAFEAALRTDVERALAGGPEAVLLRIGLDHLEHATLRRGVELSRELLRTTASALVGVVGDRVRLGRLREKQLAVRLPGASAEEVRTLADAIRERLGGIEVHPEEGGEPVGTKVSIGVARCPADARSLEFLLDAAGRALAAAQREGGDRVEDVARLGVGAVDMPPFEEGAIFRNEAMVRLVESARRAARSDASVFITGETGTGKEVIANLIHRRSARAQRPFVTVNCAAFPETLLESELFGHERGAFTGAERRREGRFELADGGTLFLDEVAEMTPSAQVKLLRVLQERQFTRLGGTRTVTVDVRIVAATNRDLEKAVADAAFREDLYYRLNVIRLEIPPLRMRREEIPPLVDLFLRESAHRTGSEPKRLTSAAMDVLYRHPWPGNVRELKNVIERCTVLTDGVEVGPEHLQLDATRGEGATYLPPQSAPQDDLNSRQRTLLDYLARHGRCTNRDYYQMAGTSPRTGLRDLQDLMTRGLLVREGKRRGAVYRLP